MIRIAITGNIASGKSSAEEFFSNKGYPTCDADKINHDILNNDTTAHTEITTAFKNYDISDENGKISRDKLGKIVFSSQKNKLILEEILHKRIFEKINDFFSQNKDSDFVFVSIPLLFETGADKMFDKIIFVSCDENIRLERLIKRNGYTREYALQRIKCQESESGKIKKSDYVINNTGNIETFETGLEEILRELTRG